MNKISVFKLFLILIVFFTSISCSTNTKKAEFRERSVDEIYNSAMNLLDSKKYKKSSEEFEEVERLHPYFNMGNQSTINVSLCSNIN